tara:strand:+ start:789 stop:1067 length:279 start_codon:yes stop_codon:yes gene_type:complete
MPTCDDYTEACFQRRYSETIEEDYLTCEVCGDRRETLHEGNACEHCAHECDECGEAFHPELLEETDDGDEFICEVCWDNRVEGEKWKEKNLC